jgi:NADH:ubiquinone oxidoreductase subunit E
MKSILVCMHQRVNPNQPSCGARGADNLRQRLNDAVSNAGLEIGVKEIQCLGECDIGPNMRLIPGGPSFHHVDEKQISIILNAAKSFL